MAALACDAGSFVCWEETVGDALSSEAWEGGRALPPTVSRLGESPSLAYGRLRSLRTLFPQSYVIGQLATILYRVPGLGPWTGRNRDVRVEPPTSLGAVASAVVSSVVQSVQQVEEVVLLNFMMQKELLVAI